MALSRHTTYKFGGQIVRDFGVQAELEEEVLGARTCRIGTSVRRALSDLPDWASGGGFDQGRRLAC